jgi:hypothetical protein
MFNLTKTAVLDTVERAVRSFVGVFFTTLIASGWVPEDNSLSVISNLSVLAKAGLSGLAAVVAVVAAFVLAVFGPKNGTTSVVPDVVDAEVIRALDPLTPDRPGD